MSRLPRVHVPGGFYHVTLRGNHREPVFFVERDRITLARLVAESADRFGARVHAYCWMTNHVHLVVQVGDEPLGRLMHRVASRYAHAVQSRVSTTGHLFERRYHALLVDVDRYLLSVIRYVHLNPVAAALVPKPGDYRWSSQADYVGDRREAWITTDFVLRMFHENRSLAVDAYRRFMGEVGSDSMRYPIPGIESNDAGFAREVTPGRTRAPVRRSADTVRRSSRTATLEQLITDLCARSGVETSELSSASRARRLTHVRALVAKAAVAAGIASIASVARRFRRDESSLRESVRRLDQPYLTTADRSSEPPESEYPRPGTA